MYALLHSVLLNLQQATANACLHQRLLDTHRQVWVRLFWGHCSFLLGAGAHKILFVPFKSLFPQPCVSSIIKLNPEPLPLWQAAADPYLCRRLKHRSVSVPVGSLCPGVHKVSFEPSEHLWQVWGLILNVILSLLQSCKSFSFALGCTVSLFGGNSTFRNLRSWELVPKLHGK